MFCSLRIGDADPGYLAPFNLIALCIFRPLRLFLPSDHKFRHARILLLKATHSPIVALIVLYEWITSKATPNDGFSAFRGPRRSAVKRQPAPPLASVAPRPRMAPSQPTGTSIHRPGPFYAASSSHEGEDDRMDAPSDADVRIAELSAKIDRLTSLVVALQPGAGVETTRF